MKSHSASGKLVDFCLVAACDVIQAARFQNHNRKNILRRDVNEECYFCESQSNVAQWKIAR